MSKSSHNGGARSRVKAPRSFTSVQADLFQQLEEPAPLDAAEDLDLGPELLGAIHTALRDARTRGLSRERIVDRMNTLLPELPRRLTLRQLNSWTAPSQDYKEFPARFISAFCAATDCDLPLRVMTQAVGRSLVDSRELAAKELGQTQIAIAQLTRHRSELTKQLGGTP